MNLFICAENGCMCSLCCDDVFTVKMMLVVNLDNNKVVYSLLICVVLKFHDLDQQVCE